MEPARPTGLRRRRRHRRRAVFALEVDTGVPRLVAYEIGTGELRWTATGDPEPSSWGLSPWVADDGQLVAGWTNVHVLDTTDGTAIWSTDWPTAVAGAPPTADISGLAVDDDTVYVGIVTEFSPGDRRHPPPRRRDDSPSCTRGPGADGAVQAVTYRLDLREPAAVWAW